MNRLIDALFFLMFTFGTGYALQKAVLHIRKAVIIEVHKGLPKMQTLYRKK